jgi:Fe2+ transport system protein B
MENSTNIENLKQDNSTEINNIISQIQQDNDSVQHNPESSMRNQHVQENTQEVNEIIDDNNEQAIEIDASIIDILLHEFKGTLSFILLFIVFSLRALDELLGTHLAFTWGENGLNMIGVSIKSLVGGIIFYILNKFII